LLGEIKSLKKQKMTLSNLVHDHEEEKLKCQTSANYPNKGDNTIQGVNQIPVDHLYTSKDSPHLIGSGSYGNCELMSWKNNDVCVKTFHTAIDISDVGMK